VLDALGLGVQHLHQHVHRAAEALDFLQEQAGRKRERGAMHAATSSVTDTHFVFSLINNRRGSLTATTSHRNELFVSSLATCGMRAPQHILSQK
jgi:hypothetical protein